MAAIRVEVKGLSQTLRRIDRIRRGLRTEELRVGKMC